LEEKIRGNKEDTEDSHTDGVWTWRRDQGRTGGLKGRPLGHRCIRITRTRHAICTKKQPPNQLSRSSAKKSIAPWVERRRGKVRERRYPAREALTAKKGWTIIALELN
jgi:hypothetical protein